MVRIDFVVPCPRARSSSVLPFEAGSFEVLPVDARFAFVVRDGIEQVRPGRQVGIEERHAPMMPVAPHGRIV